MTLSMNIIIIIITCLISYQGIRQPNFLHQTLLWPYEMKRNPKQMYRFITSGFVHANFPHLLFNMFTLYFCGELLVYVLGPIQYAIFYILAIIFSDLSFYVKHKDQYQYRSLGASGAVSAVLFAIIYILPWENFYLFAILPIPAIILAILFITYSYQMGKKQQDTVNHGAHLFGALFGFLYMLIVVDKSHGIDFLHRLMDIPYFK